MPETRSVTDLRPHPDHGLVPEMTQEERDALYEDIVARGIAVPLDVTPDGLILDGRHRHGIAIALGLAEVPVRVVDVPPAEQRDYLIRMAVLRRHLSAAQRRELAAKLLRDEPGQSDRKVADAVGLSHQTIGRMRDELGATGPLDQLETRTGVDGRTRLAPEAARARAIANNPDLAAREEAARLRRLWSGSMVHLSGVLLKDPETYVPLLDRGDIDLLRSTSRALRAWLDRIDGLIDGARMRAVN